MNILKRLLYVLGGILTSIILQKKKINILSVKGILISVVAAILFVSIIEFLFQMI